MRAEHFPQAAVRASLNRCRSTGPSVQGKSCSSVALGSRGPGVLATGGRGAGGSKSGAGGSVRKSVVCAPAMGGAAWAACAAATACSGLCGRRVDGPPESRVRASPWPDAASRSAAAASTSRAGRERRTGDRAAALAAPPLRAAARLPCLPLPPLPVAIVHRLVEPKSCGHRRRRGGQSYAAAAAARSRSAHESRLATRGPQRGVGLSGGAACGRAAPARGPRARGSRPPGRARAARAARPRRRRRCRRGRASRRARTGAAA